MAVHYDFLTVPYRGRDFRLAYFQRPGKSSCVLYLHGLGGSKTDFVPAAAFPGLEDHTLVGIDIPGCAQSNYFADLALGLQDVAEIIRNAIAALRLPPFTLVGHSFSGITALLLIEKHPSIVRKFVNIEGNLAPEDCYIFSREVCSFGFVGREEEYFAHLRHRLLQAGGCTQRTYAETFRANVWSPQAWYDYCKSIVYLSDHKSLLRQFIELKIPRLFLYGEENRHLTYLPALRESTVGVLEVPGSNHFTAYSNPEFHYKGISDFVNEGSAGNGKVI